MDIVVSSRWFHGALYFWHRLTIARKKRQQFSYQSGLESGEFLVLLSMAPTMGASMVRWWCIIVSRGVVTMTVLA